MRNLIIAFCFVAAIITINVFIGNRIKDSYENISSLGEKYLHSLEANDFNSAENILKEMKEHWEKDEVFMKYIANHNTVEDIGASIKLSEIYLKYKDAPHAAAQCKELMYYMEHLYHNERVELGNIF